MKHKRSLLSIAMASIMLVSLCAVCVSTTSVTAAPSSAPAGIVGAPAVCARDANSLDLFVRGTDNACWWRHEAGGVWSAWQSLGGILTSSPAAATDVYGSYIIHVAVRGADGALYSRWTSNGGTSWSPWYMVGGQLLAGTSPAVVFPHIGTVRYVVTGTNHQLYYNTSTRWQSLGGYLTSSPAAASYGTNQVMVAARGADGSLYYRYTDEAGSTWPFWHGWTSYGGQSLAGTDPAAARSGIGKYVFRFVIGTNHQLYCLSNLNIGWENLGGYLTSSPAATSPSAGMVHVFAVGSNGAIYSRNTTNNGASWNPWYRLPA